MIYTYSLMRKSPTGPYAIAYVTLKEGPSVQTNIVDCDLDEPEDRPEGERWCGSRPTARRCRSSRRPRCFPSPVVGEGGAKRRMRGSLREHCDRGTNPSPKRVCCGAGDASPQGERAQQWHRRRKFGRETTMPINYEQLMALKNLGQKYAYTDREVMLYAYGIGLGADPMDEKELAYRQRRRTFTPRPLKVVPTFASVAAWGSGPGDMKLNRVMVVDGERDITFHKPLPVRREHHRRLAPCSTCSTRARTRAR